jgi:hypothetical protein
MKALIRSMLVGSISALSLIVMGEPASAGGVESRVWYVPATPTIQPDPGGMKYLNSLIVTDLSGAKANVSYWVGDKKYGSDFVWNGEAVVVIADQPVIVERDYYQDIRFGRLAMDDRTIYRSRGHEDFGSFALGRILGRVTELAYAIDCSEVGPAHVACKHASVKQAAKPDKAVGKNVATVAPASPSDSGK